MTYRDEAEALRAQLAERDAEIARLRGELEQRRSGRTSSALGVTESRWAGGASRLELSVSVPGELRMEDHGDVLSSVQAALGSAATPSTVGRTLRITVGQENEREMLVTITPRDGATEIRMTERYDGLMGVVFGAIGGGAGGTGMMMSIFGALVGLDGPLAAMSAIGLAATWLGGTYAGTRAIYGAMARKRVSEGQRLHAALVRATSESIARAAPKVRVATDADAVHEDESDEATERPVARAAGRSP